MVALKNLSVSLLYNREILILNIHVLSHGGVCGGHQ